MYTVCCEVNIICTQIIGRAIGLLPLNCVFAGVLVCFVMVVAISVFYGVLLCTFWGCPVRYKSVVLPALAQWKSIRFLPVVSGVRIPQAGLSNS